MRAELAAELGLRDPEITWHVARDGLVEIVCLLAAIGGSVGKIGADVALLCCGDLVTELRTHPVVVASLGAERIDRLCDPAAYLGGARAMTTSVLSGHPSRGTPASS
ncbi:hypothetical protein SAMN05216188_12140 [Lentzea xinjiangensis]|uniref:3-carboxy-cis,cis-muconate cycloisomerase n=1 Tax=Lentzea xinjiangensis TaxID=402600 RepID=A0A1H9UDW7_9PSEU|nr:hypothetical protein [Lentzea xinjiangensis]SES07364.1 hypothetical protein SAMN05216188_12140 [Lentzea xinjiangensis]